MIDQVRSFLALLSRADLSPESRLIALAEALDCLSLAYHRTPRAPISDEGPDMSEDLPNREELRAALAPHFPELGPYTFVVPEYGTAAVTMLGHALDDLVDIAREMHEVAWLWENGRREQAQSQFRFGYSLVWGRHLHNLRGQLHFQLFGC